MLIKNIDINKFDTDNDLYYYIKACIENKARNIEKSIKIKNKIEILGEKEGLFQSISDGNWYSDFSDVELKCMLENLNSKEKLILYKRYYLQFTDEELAKELNISRQAVNKARKKALKNVLVNFTTVIIQYY